MKTACLLSLILGAGFLSAGENWWDNLGELPGPGRDIAEVIDESIDADLAEKGITPVPSAAPGKRLRRLMLDLNGRIPTISELDRFEADNSGTAWSNQVDDLILSSGFDRFLAHELNWLLMDGKSTDFRKYLEHAVTTEMPWDAVTRDIIVGMANDDELKGVDYFLRDRIRDIDKITNDVSVRFFGVNISCAQCHDHPYVKDWTQETYYGMRAFFTRTFENGGMVAERAYGEQSYKNAEGEEFGAKPRFLGSEPIMEPAALELNAYEKKAERELLNEYKKKKQAPPAPEYSRRARLAELALEDDYNIWLARALVNRTWNRLFGHGFVMPVDQMHGENPPSHPELLQWLALDLIENNFDMRRMIRGMVSTNAYQRSSIWEQGDRPAPGTFAVATVRPLTPRQYAVAMKFGSAKTSHFPADLPLEDYSKRIMQTEGSGAGLARWFQRPDENFQVAVDEALLLSNSIDVKNHFFNYGLRDQILKLDDDEKRIQLAYRSILSRKPDDQEISILKTYLNDRSGSPREAVEQMLWAVLTSSEARFNH